MKCLEEAGGVEDERVGVSLGVVHYGPNVDDDCWSPGPPDDDENNNDVVVNVDGH